MLTRNAVLEQKIESSSLKEEFKNSVKNDNYKIEEETSPSQGLILKVKCTMLVTTATRLSPTVELENFRKGGIVLSRRTVYRGGITLVRSEESRAIQRAFALHLR